jgi:Domain of unknown function (DUF4919)
MTNRNLIVSFVLLIVLFASAGTLAAQGPGPRQGQMMRPEPPKDPEYVKLLDKAQNGDTAIDFKALRMAYARSGAPGSRSVDPKIRAKLVEAIKAKKYNDIASSAQEILKIHFLDLNVHAYAASAYMNLKDIKKQDFHQAIYLGLINSIVEGSNGESPKTAYMVVSPDEMFAVLNAYELTKVSSEVITEGTSRYELVSVTDKANGAASKVYFNVDMMPKPPERPAKP